MWGRVNRMPRAAHVWCRHVPRSYVVVSRDDASTTDRAFRRRARTRTTGTDADDARGRKRARVPCDRVIVAPRVRRRWPKVGRARDGRSRGGSRVRLWRRNDGRPDGATETRRRDGDWVARRRPDGAAETGRRGGDRTRLRGTLPESGAPKREKRDGSRHRARAATPPSGRDSSPTRIMTHYSTLYYIVLHCIALYYITLHCITLRA